jgi:hypothetical protein
VVDTVLDPIRMPIITLSQAELDEIETAMSAGQLPADFLDRYYAAVQENVFGRDHKTDRQGNPIEQGIGSSGNQTRNSINAYKKYGKYEADFTPEKFAADVKRMEAELAVCNEAREAAGNGRRGRRPGARR